MIVSLPHIEIPESALHWNFHSASGPGGQHVNRTASAVHLRVDLAVCTIEQRRLHRLISLAGSRITKENELIITASGSRSQRANREEALERLAELCARAEILPRPRKKTKPTHASREKRIDTKKQRSSIKKSRKPPQL